jgi:hypothetical protein
MFCVREMETSDKEDTSTHPVPHSLLPEKPEWTAQPRIVRASERCRNRAQAGSQKAN